MDRRRREPAIPAAAWERIDNGPCELDFSKPFMTEADGNVIAVAQRDMGVLRFGHFVILDPDPE